MEGAFSRFYSIRKDWIACERKMARPATLSPVLDFPG
jgi:hypothetical protein